MKQVNQVGVDVDSEALVCMMKRAGQPQPLARFAQNTRLTVLPGVGHMIQYAAPDLVISEVEAMAAALAPSTAAAAAN